MSHGGDAAAYRRAAVCMRRALVREHGEEWVKANEARATPASPPRLMRVHAWRGSRNVLAYEVQRSVKQARLRLAKDVKLRTGELIKAGTLIRVSIHACEEVTDENVRGL